MNNINNLFSNLEDLFFNYEKLNCDKIREVLLEPIYDENRDMIVTFLTFLMIKDFYTHINYLIVNNCISFNDLMYQHNNIELTSMYWITAGIQMRRLNQSMFALIKYINNKQEMNFTFKLEENKHSPVHLLMGSHNRDDIYKFVLSKYDNKCEIFFDQITRYEKQTVNIKEFCEKLYPEYEVEVKGDTCIIRECDNTGLRSTFNLNTVFQEEDNVCEKYAYAKKHYSKESYSLESIKDGDCYFSKKTASNLEYDLYLDENSNVLYRSLPLQEKYHNSRRKFREMLNSCLENKKRFIVFSLGLMMVNGGHANTLIYDKKNKTLERFEPNTGFIDDMYDPVKVDEYIFEDFSSFLEIKKYYTPKDYIPYYSLQIIEGTQTRLIKNYEERTREKKLNDMMTGWRQFLIEKNKNEDGKFLEPEQIPFIFEEDLLKNSYTEYDNGGYCVTWSLVWLETRLKNPDVPIEKLIRRLLFYIFLKYKGNFARFIKGMRNRYIFDFSEFIMDFKIVENVTISESEA